MAPGLVENGARFTRVAEWPGHHAPGDLAHACEVNALAGLAGFGGGSMPAMRACASTACPADGCLSSRGGHAAQLPKLVTDVNLAEADAGAVTFSRSSNPEGNRAGVKVDDRPVEPSQGLDILSMSVNCLPITYIFRGGFRSATAVDTF